MSKTKKVNLTEKQWKNSYNAYKSWYKYNQRKGIGQQSMMDLDEYKAAYRTVVEEKGYFSTYKYDKTTGKSKKTKVYASTAKNTAKMIAMTNRQISQAQAKGSVRAIKNTLDILDERIASGVHLDDIQQDFVNRYKKYFKLDKTKTLKSGMTKTYTVANKKGASELKKVLMSADRYLDANNEYGGLYDTLRQDIEDVTGDAYAKVMYRDEK